MAEVFKTSVPATVAVRLRTKLRRGLLDWRAGCSYNCYPSRWITFHL